MIIVQSVTKHDNSLGGVGSFKKLNKEFNTEEDYLVFRNRVLKFIRRKEPNVELYFNFLLT